MKPVAFIYTCRNPGQVALLWAHQPPPFGHGWIDVKRVGLVREDEVSEVVRKQNELLRIACGATPETLAECEAISRDAERYRWIMDNVDLTGYTTDDDIDAAMLRYSK